jgi:hypothetical protein
MTSVGSWDGGLSLSYVTVVTSGGGTEKKTWLLLSASGNRFIVLVEIEVTGIRTPFLI